MLVLMLLVSLCLVIDEVIWLGNSVIVDVMLVFSGLRFVSSKVGNVMNDLLFVRVFWVLV